MNERRQDFDLLQRFTREGEQSAFADVVRRHFNLVFATALRKVADTGAAQEVAQNVFSALARKAWQFAPDDSLPAWLHKAALLESKSWLRGELGRRRREETAVELGTTMKSPDEQLAFHALVPLLDEALLSLREKDRTALLLRFSEGQSLRDVGTAFGVSEDTAQKRVQSALEKLAEFFKRRGFKTASVVATAAALQHTAASASATMVSAVVSAALQVAPPALVGLSALIARLASMSRVQTAAVCVALAAVPLAWQLNERRDAGEEVKRTRTQLLAAQNQHANLQTETERLRVSSGQLEQSLVQANEAAARAAASAQAFEVWKKKTHGQLTSTDYRWPDDSPFVRIPKSALPELSETSDAEPISSPGVIKPYARELLGLTPSERQSLEERLHRHFADVDGMKGRMREGIHETNTPSWGRFPDAIVASNVFVHPGLGDEAKKRADQLVAELHGTLGEERWPLLQIRFSDKRGGNVYSGGYSLAAILHLDPDESSQELRVWVTTDDKGAPAIGYTWASSGTIRNGVGALAMFLPEDDPNRKDSSNVFGTNSWAASLSEPLRQRALAWFQEQATARLGKGARR